MAFLLIKMTGCNRLFQRSNECFKVVVKIKNKYHAIGGSILKFKVHKGGPHDEII